MAAFDTFQVHKLACAKHMKTKKTQPFCPCPVELSTSTLPDFSGSHQESSKMTFKIGSFT